MNLLELSNEYRRTGEVCRARLRDYKSRLLAHGLTDAERAVLQRSITLLSAIVRECIATSIYLEHYYGRNAS